MNIMVGRTATLSYQMRNNAVPFNSYSLSASSRAYLDHFLTLIPSRHGVYTNTVRVLLTCCNGAQAKMKTERENLQERKQLRKFMKPL